MRNMTRSNIYILIGASVICILLSMLMGKCSRTESQTKVEADTAFQEHIDTEHLTHAVTKRRPQPTRTDTIFVTDAQFGCLTDGAQTQEVAQHIKKTYEVDSLHIDTTCTPPASVNYHLLVRTDNYDVDSISLRFNVDYPKIIQTQTITKTITKKKRWNYGIQTGFGYGIYNRKPDLYIGVGLTYNF